MSARTGIFAVLAICVGVLLIPRPALAQSAQRVTGAGSGAYPAGATWNGVSLSAMKFGTGVSLKAGGVAKGLFATTIAGTSVAGLAQNIVVDGTATTGSSPAGGPATYSGNCTLDMGDGTPSLLSVPFTVTVTTSATGQSTLALTVNGRPLPVASITGGGVGIR
jgi:hypothetical protein